MTELVFADRDAYAAWAAAVFKPGAAEQVVTDEARFLDRASGLVNSTIPSSRGAD